MTDFVLLSTADWDHPLWTNKQHTASSLADLGHRVLYIDSLGVRAPRGDRSDARRIIRRLRRGLRAPRLVRTNLYVISPLVLPGHSTGLFGRLNRWSLRLSLFLADCFLDFHNPQHVDRYPVRGISACRRGGNGADLQRARKYCRASSRARPSLVSARHREPHCTQQLPAGAAFVYFILVYPLPLDL